MRPDRTAQAHLPHPETSAVLRGRKEQLATGPLLRSRAGKPWTVRGIFQAMRRLRKKAGGSGRTITDGYRHTFATDALVKGLPFLLQGVVREVERQPPPIESPSGTER